MRTNVLLIRIFFVFLLSFSISVGNNTKNENLNRMRHDNSLKAHGENLLEDGLFNSKNVNDFISLLRNRNSLYKINSNYVLSKEIREANPPFGEPSKEKSEFSYDGKGNNTQVLRSMWENSDWTVQGRGNISYDEYNREIELLNEVWENSGWKEWFKQTTSYNSNNQILEIVGYYKYTDSWEGSWRNTNTYDDKNNLLESLFEWANGGSWATGSKNEYKYDENGLLVEETYKYYDNGSWTNGEMYLYTYDESENNTEMLQKMWSGSSWDNFYKQEISYNENNKPTSILGYILEESNWRNNTRWTSTYDEHGNNVEYLFEQNWDGTGWKDFEKITREFSQFITAVDDRIIALPKDFSLEQNYPNPFNPSTKITYSIQNQSYVTLKVIDIVGREIRTLINKEQSQGSYSIEFDASGLTSGIYFYRIQAGKFVETKKMILMK